MRFHPAMRAIARGDLAMFQSLLAQDPELGTALHWAAVRGERRACELLLARGANPALEDITARNTPAEWARVGGHEDLAVFLSGRTTTS